MGDNIMSSAVDGISIGSGEYNFTKKDLKKISDVVRQESGIVLSDAKASLVYSRLSKRIRKLGLSSFSQYCELIDSQDNLLERKELVDALTTNVTGFFRESHHFDYMREKVLPGLIERAKAGEQIRMWSAACSSGQEPYSMAITLLQAMPDASRYDIRILATDIDTNILSVAMRGVYDESLVLPVPEKLRTKYFKLMNADEKHFQISDEVRQIVSFRHLNLIGSWPIKKKIQVIFCRNVVIYFDNDTQETLWSRFMNVLDDDGALYIGHSERITGPAIKFVKSDGITAYRKMVK